MFCCYTDLVKPPGTSFERKTYGQACTVAMALDCLGDRWTLLIIRELLGGPARFSELRAGLPGIASNLLSERLQRLESDGIVRQSSAPASAYSLTDLGAAARTAIEELGYWGTSLTPISPPEHERSIRAIAMALQAILNRTPYALPAERSVIELEMDGNYLELILDGRPTVTARLCTTPDARARVTMPELSAYLNNPATGQAALTHVSGNEGATRHLEAALASFAPAGQGSHGA